MDSSGAAQPGLVGLLFFLFSVRLLRLLRALASTVRRGYIVRIFVMFLHGESKIRQHAGVRKGFLRILDTQR